MHLVLLRSCYIEVMMFMQGRGGGEESGGERGEGGREERGRGGESWDMVHPLQSFQES